MGHDSELAYEEVGSGVPIVFLHGLTFDRRTWRPIIEPLGDSVHSIAIDLPAHGDSAGPPVSLDDVAAQVHELVAALELKQPIVVGHSMSGGLALLYAAEHATRGVVIVDNSPDTEPFARLVQQLEPALRGSNFADVWQTFESTLGLEQIPEPTRSLVLATHKVNQDVVVGYWDMLLRRDPSELQAWIDLTIVKVNVPCLGVFGRLVTDQERTQMDRLPEMQLEEWVGDGHFVHLVDPDRFAGRLSKFIDHCTSTT